VMRLELRDDKRADAVGVLGISGWAASLPILMSFSLDLAPRVVLLIAMPPVMVITTYFNIHVMARALDSPLKPPIARWASYVLLLGIDVMVALVRSGGAMAVTFFSLAPIRATTTGGRVTMFWAAHMAVSAYLILGVTAWRESLRSWVWRFRGRVPVLRDRWFG